MTQTITCENYLLAYLEGIIINFSLTDSDDPEQSKESQNSGLVMAGGPDANDILHKFLTLLWEELVHGNERQNSASHNNFFERRFCDALKQLKKIK